jgi:hypothetical protein
MLPALLISLLVISSTGHTQHSLATRCLPFFSAYLTTNDFVCPRSVPLGHLSRPIPHTGACFRPSCSTHILPCPSGVGNTINPFVNLVNNDSLPHQQNSQLTSDSARNPEIGSRGSMMSLLSCANAPSALSNSSCSPFSAPPSG